MMGGGGLGMSYSEAMQRTIPQAMFLAQRGGRKELTKQEALERARALGKHGDDIALERINEARRAVGLPPRKPSNAVR